MRDEIMRGADVTPVPYPEVTMIFSDIVGFTRKSSTMTPEEINDFLSRLHDDLFSRILAEHGAYHVENIGDAMIAVTNFPRASDKGGGRDSHQAAAVRIGIAMTEAARSLDLEVRVGVATGPAVATIVGRVNPKLTLLGDVCNLAARLETASAPGTVTVSQQTQQALEPDARFTFAAGKLEELKGKGFVKTFRAVAFRELGGPPAPARAPATLATTPTPGEPLNDDGAGMTAKAEARRFKRNRVRNATPSKQGAEM
jgi:class 3 adenylate cyclase